METTLTTNQTASFIYASDRVFLRNIDSGVQPLWVCVWKGNLYAYFYNVYSYVFKFFFRVIELTALYICEADAPLLPTYRIFQGV